MPRRKKEEPMEEAMEEPMMEEAVGGMPMITHDYKRKDLNDMRDRVNELMAKANQ